MANTNPMFGGAASSAPGSIIVEGVDPLIGLNLGGYVVTKLLASGGMGLVYEAQHETIGRRAAVKVLKPEVASDAQWTKRFLTEARAIASLNHRNIVEILNFGNTPDGRQYMMMAFLEGESLEQYISRTAPLPPAVALGIADQILNGLAEAHKKGVVHRDLKPSNVVLLREHSGELLPKILDFGLARQDPVSMMDLSQVPRAREGTSLLAGTPEYIAPEQAQGLKVDPVADLYSLGVMLFEMVTARLPFSAPTVMELMQKHVNDSAPRVSSLVENLPEGLEPFIESLLEKEPSRRPASADVARQTVQRLIKKIASEATTIRPLPKSPRDVPTLKVERPATDNIAANAPTRDVSAAEPAKVAPGRRRTAALAAGIVLLALVVGYAAVKGGATTPSPLGLNGTGGATPPATPPTTPPGLNGTPAGPGGATMPSTPVAVEVAPPPAVAAPPATPVRKTAQKAALKPKPEERTTAAGEDVACVPTEAWKSSMHGDLARFLGQSAISESDERRVGNAIDEASTHAQCLRVTRDLAQLVSHH